MAQYRFCPARRYVVLICSRVVSDQQAAGAAEWLEVIRLRSMAVIGTVLASFGLILDIVGAFLLYKYGLPARVNRGGVQPFILEQVDELEAQKALQFERNGRWGLALLIAGFGFQLVGNLWLGPQ
jgi:hypothetical protein